VNIETTMEVMKMGILIKIILGEVAVLLALLILVLLIHIWLLLRKKIVVPELTVATDKPSYDHTEDVNISGTLKEDGQPMAGKTISIKIVPPEGEEIELADVQTDEEGEYAAVWDIPVDAVPGTYKVEATGMGVTATTTFTLGNNHRKFKNFRD